jgi:hypothetical protein
MGARMKLAGGTQNHCSSSPPSQATLARASPWLAQRPPYQTGAMGGLEETRTTHIKPFRSRPSRPMLGIPRATSTIAMNLSAETMSRRGSPPIASPCALGRCPGPLHLSSSAYWRPDGSRFCRAALDSSPVTWCAVVPPRAKRSPNPSV